MLTSCYSDPKLVNDQARPIILPMAPMPYGETDMAPIIGVSGSVITAGNMPVPASGASVSLHRIEPDGSKKKVGEMTTGPDGRFQFSQKLSKGDYFIRVDSRKFVGEKSLRNLSKPTEDLVIEVEEKKRLAQ